MPPSPKSTAPAIMPFTPRRSSSSSSSTAVGVNSNNGANPETPTSAASDRADKAIRKRSSLHALRTASNVLASSLSSTASASGRSSSSPQAVPGVIAATADETFGYVPGVGGGSLPRAIVAPVALRGHQHPHMSVSPSRGAFFPGRAGSPASAASEREVALLVSEHLVEPEDLGTSSPVRGSSIGYGAEAVGSSISHVLQGGAITHDIYQWKQKRLSSDHHLHKRRNSEPDLSNLRRSPELVTASDLQEPGMFRRHFVRKRAQQQGRSASIFTRNFIDFLVLYGFYGGDVLPEELEDDDGANAEDGNDGEEEGESAPHAIGSDGDDGHDRRHTNLLPNEHTPLIRTTSSSLANTTTSVHGTSAKKVFFMLFKSFIGTGVLFLPKAFSLGGMGFSMVLLALIGFLTLHCMLLLVETSRVLGGSFGDIGEKLYGRPVRQLVLWSIAISQAGFGCAYFIFVSQNLRDLTMIVSDCKWIFPDYYFIILQIFAYIPLAWVRRIKHFSVTSLIADVFILAGLAYIFYHDLQILTTVGVAPNIVWFNLESFSLFIGTAMFAFEGICLILPIAESMKKPEQFGWVLTSCISLIGAIFITIGAAGYLSFGSKVETVVFLNMPKGSKLVLLLQFLYTMAIMLSFPLCAYPPIRIIETALFGVLDGKSSRLVKWQKNAFRAIFVGLLAFIAWAGSNNLDKFVSLVGCLACIPLSFIYPALFHYHIAKSSWIKAKDLFLVFIGIIALFYTTYITVEQWVVGSPDIPIDRCSTELRSRL